MQRASPHLREALRLAPGAADIHEDLGVSLAAMGQIDEELLELREALRLKPTWPLAMARVALLLATHPNPRLRDVQAAIRLADRASKLTAGTDPMSLEVLAAAYAAAGRFDEAARRERKVLEIASATGNRELAAAARGALDLYERGFALPANLPSPGSHTTP